MDWLSLVAQFGLPITMFIYILWSGAKGHWQFKAQADAANQAWKDRYENNDRQWEERFKEMKDQRDQLWALTINQTAINEVVVEETLKKEPRIRRTQ